jgi:signal transduction histidine kinase
MEFATQKASFAEYATADPMTEHNYAQRILDATQLRLSELEKERGIREQFVLALTHDLRMPLTAAKTCSELVLLKTSRNAMEHKDCRQLSNKVLDALSRAEKMIRDLLDASSIRAGERLPLQIKSFFISQLVIETIQTLETTYGARFQYQWNKDSFVYWDYDGIRRLLENLLINAIKYGSKDVIIINFVEKESFITISVNNKGSYIPESKLKSLFELFKTNGKNRQGWGVGLTLVRGISEAHHGKVSAESSEDKGTTFIVTLPIDCRTLEII